ncbi:MAG: hypothetical protein ACK5LC_12560 [Coprobacillaceae bacterium]
MEIKDEDQLVAIINFEIIEDPSFSYTINNDMISGYGETFCITYKDFNHKGELMTIYFNGSILARDAEGNLYIGIYADNQYNTLVGTCEYVNDKMIIKLESHYLNTLSNGEHILTVSWYSMGKYQNDEHKFTIDRNTTITSSELTNKKTTVNTGDSQIVGLYMLGSIISIVGMIKFRREIMK